jgi:ankyrin repeat protein
MTKLLLEKGADPNHKGGFKAKDGPSISTPLGLAISYGRLDLAKLLLAHGAEIDGWDNSSKTPLLWTITKDLPSMSKFLLDNGANPALRDEKTGRTPLHLAVGRGNETITSILLKAGGLPDAKDEENISPSYLSAYYGYSEITRLLREYGAKSANVDADINEAQRVATDIQLAKQLRTPVLSGTGPSQAAGSWFFRSPRS